jgi:SAM-dependent methyltransferase
MSSKSRVQLESWLSTLDIDYDKVLDIGGCQLPCQGRTKSWNVNEYLFLDLEQPHIEKVKPDIIADINHAFIYTSQKAGTEYVDRKYLEYFDAIFMLEVLEYVWNPAYAFLNCSELLKDGGKLYLSFHFMYPYHNPAEVDYLRYTPNGIDRLLEENGFKTIDFKPRTLSPEAYESYVKTYLTDGMKRCIDSNIIGGMLIAEKI